MAKQKLTKTAISFIIECKNDQNQNYTFKDIAELVNRKFEINVSLQAISKAYHKHKENTHSNSNTCKTVSLKTEHFTDEKNKKNQQQVFKTSGFNENAGDSLSKKDVQNLLD